MLELVAIVHHAPSVACCGGRRVHNRRRQCSSHCLWRTYLLVWYTFGSIVSEKTISLELERYIVVKGYLSLMVRYGITVTSIRFRECPQLISVGKPCLSVPRAMRKDCVHFAAIITSPCQIALTSPASLPPLITDPNRRSRARSAVDPHGPSLLAQAPWSRHRHMDNLHDSMHERVDRGLRYQPSGFFSLYVHV